MVPTDVAAWRAQVDKELAGAPFEKLIHTTAEGFALQPLYAEWTGDVGVPGAAPYVRGATAAGAAQPARVCTRVDSAAAIADDVEGGADVLWLDLGNAATLAAAVAAGRDILVETELAPAAALAAVTGARVLVVANDPITRAARGGLAADGIAAELDAIARAEAAPGRRHARVSSVPFHDAGADAADELALLLSSGVAVLRAFDAAGRDAAAANAALAMQVAIGRDTFGEVCKLRALRTCWHRILAASGAANAAPPPVHAICSTRSQSQRDPWVNMLRVTTQVFAAMLGGADWVTPSSFDQVLGEALGVQSPLGRRTARNTALVLRDESHLGRVVDAAGGSYYIEARTDALAREAWSRFQAFEKDGGVVALLASGKLHERLAASWSKRAAAVARRKEPLLGVSDFANLDEKLPAPPIAPEPATVGALPRHRDAEAFEALRTRLEAGPAREVVLLALGPPAEHRGRTGYSSALFATIGLRTRESATPVAADIAVICGSDERYATEAAATARALRAAGARRVILAGKPGALEPDLRAAGVAGFIFVGADVLTTLTELVS